MGARTGYHHQGPGPHVGQRQDHAERERCRIRKDILLNRHILAGSCGFCHRGGFEELEVKKDLLARLEKVCDKDIVFATNTSSISITEIAAASDRPEKIVGMHFF